MFSRPGFGEGDKGHTEPMTARAWATFVAVSVLWGITYLFIKVAAEDLDPAMVVFLRAAIAVAILAPLAVRSGAFRVFRGRLGALVVLAVLDFAAPFWLIAAGEEVIDSSLTAMLIASLPLVVAVLALRFEPDDRLTGARWVGLGVGFAGVGLLLGVSAGGSRDELLGAGAVLAAAVLYAAAAFYYQRHFVRDDPVAVVTATLFISAALLLVPALLSAPAAMPSGDVVASIVVLGVFCTAAAYVLWYRLLAEVGSNRASVVTYVNPAVAVLAGVLVLGESLTPGAIAGLLLILAGSYLATRSQREPIAT